jgi:hypothetical protein
MNNYLLIFFALYDCLGITIHAAPVCNPAAAMVQSSPAARSRIATPGPARLPI